MGVNLLLIILGIPRQHLYDKKIISQRKLTRVICGIDKVPEDLLNFLSKQAGLTTSVMSEYFSRDEQLLKRQFIDLIVKNNFSGEAEEALRRIDRIVDKAIRGA